MLASAFCQYFARLAYSSLYYGVVRQRQKHPEGKINKTTKWQKCAMPEARLAKRKICAKGKKGKKCSKCVNKGAMK